MSNDPLAKRANTEKQTSVSPPVDREGMERLKALLRQQYPHVPDAQFYEYLADESLSGWDDVRDELKGYVAAYALGVSEERARLQQPLKSLRNEIVGMLGMDETGMRVLFGLTNVQVLKLRVREADAALSSSAPQEQTAQAEGKDI